MSLIGRMVNKLLTTGSITLKQPGKAPEELGRPGAKHLTVRFADRRVPFDILRNAGVNAHVRKSRGRDIDAACGQLRRKTESEQLVTLGGGG